MNENLRDAYILIVDDNPKNLQLLSSILNDQGYQIVVAENGERALKAVAINQPDLMLLDVMMPVMNGYETCKKLKESSITQNIPIIFLTALTDSRSIIKGFNYGAIDYVTKPFNSPELLARVKTHLELKFNRNMVLKQRNELEEKVNQRTSELVKANKLLQKKITDYEHAEIKIEKLNKELEKKVQELEVIATTDSLTKCPNKIKLKEDLQNEKRGSLIYFKISNFIEINDALGFDAADSVILQLMKFLKEWLEESTKLYRCTNSEFAIIININSESVVEFCEKLERGIGGFHFSYKKTRVILALIISVSSLKFEDPFRNALLALEEAKREKVIKVYSEALNYKDQYLKHLVEFKNVAEGFEQNKFFPVFQGIRDNRPDSPHYKKIQKFECLIRLESGDKVLAPYFFLGALERSREMTRATKTMIMKSFEMMSHYDYDFSLNLTEQDLLDETLLEFVRYQLKGNKINPHRVIFEILEGISSTDSDSILQLLDAFRDLGCKIAIDDFGAEQSNIGRLLNFAPDFIKIDAKFIKNLADNRNSRIIVENICDLARRIGAEVVAEYVETEEIQAVLEEIGVHFSQGYLFSKPDKKIPPKN